MLIDPHALLAGHSAGFVLPCQESGMAATPKRDLACPSRLPGLNTLLSAEIKEQIETEWRHTLCSIGWSGLVLFYYYYYYYYFWVLAGLTPPFFMPC